MQRTRLPARPLGLAVGRQAGALAVIGVLVVLTGGSAWEAASAVLDLGRIEHEQAVWAGGQEGLRPTVTARQRDRIVVSETLEVGYADNVGVYQTHAQSFSLLGLPPNLDRPPVVRFDPANPSDFAVSWALEVRDARARFAMAGGAAFALAALFGLYLLVSVTRALVRQRRLASRGDEVAAIVVAVRSRGGTQAHVYDVAWRTAESARPYTSVIDGRAGTLAWLDDRGELALALVSRDRALGLLLRSDLHPLEMTAAERAAAVAQLEAAGGGARRGPLR